MWHLLQHATSTRFCGGLILVIVCVQLYLFALWTQPFSSTTTLSSSSSSHSSLHSSQLYDSAPSSLLPPSSITSSSRQLSSSSSSTASARRRRNEKKDTTTTQYSSNITHSSKSETETGGGKGGKNGGTGISRSSGTGGARVHDRTEKSIATSSSTTNNGRKSSGAGRISRRKSVQGEGNDKNWPFSSSTGIASSSPQRPPSRPPSHSAPKQMLRTPNPAASSTVNLVQQPTLDTRTSVAGEAKNIDSERKRKVNYEAGSEEGDEEGGDEGGAQADSDNGYTKLMVTAQDLLNYPGRSDSSIVPFLIGPLITDGLHARHKHAKHKHHADDKHTNAELSVNPSIYQSLWLNFSLNWAEHQLYPTRHHLVLESEQDRYYTCIDLYTAYHVIPEQSWGTLPQGQRRDWETMKCNNIVSTYLAAKYILDNKELYDRKWPVPQNREIIKPQPGYENKTIAILICITTRGLDIIDFREDLSLFSDLFETMKDTLDVGFEYWVYLTYDADDPWFDDEDNLQDVREWFHEYVELYVKETYKITCKLIMTRYQNPYHLPGPAFNYLSEIAYADGVTWLYRINDDLRFETKWAARFVQEQEQMGMPYGVVGPNVISGPLHILVVDFIHRTHHTIFPTHYPHSLQSWWMDNWISWIYGKKRTRMIGDVKVRHLINSHGTRYATIGHAQYMRGEVLHGRSRLQTYFSHTPGMSQILKEYEEDSFTVDLIGVETEEIVEEDEESEEEEEGKDTGSWW